MTESILEPSAPTQKADKKAGFARKLLVLIGALSLLALGAAGVFAVAKQKPELLGLDVNRENKDLDSKAELESLLKEVSKIIELPEGEIPTLATVTNLNEVKEQPFFAKAKNGDKVLVYTNSKKAILYRPTDKKVIEVGVVNTPAPTGEVAGESSGDIEVITPTPIVRSTESPTQTIAPTNTPTPTP